MLTFTDLPAEQQRLMIGIVVRLNHVEAMLAQCNYGLAADTIADIKAKDLPRDTRQDWVWHALERATS